MLDPVHEKLLEAQTQATKDMAVAITLLCFRIETLCQTIVDQAKPTTRKTKATK